MKTKKIVFAVALTLPILFYACTKNSTPTPPIHDTTTIIKTDTLRIPILPDTPNVKNGLILYLPFNGSMADSSGNGNLTAAVGGATLTYDAHGYSNSAFGGTGNGERLIVTNNGSIKFDTAFSISLDVMVRSFQLQDLVTMVQNTTGTGVSFGVGLGIGTTNRYDFAVTNSGTDCNAIIGPTNSAIDSSTYVIQPASWYNIISVFHKGTMQTFINGQLISVKTSVSTTVPICPSSQVIIGGWWQGGGATVNGILDEVRLYNRSLNAKEIAWLARNFQTTSTKVKPVIKTR
jgi:hypothetical protein